MGMHFPAHRDNEYYLYYYHPFLLTWPDALRFWLKVGSLSLSTDFILLLREIGLDSETWDEDDEVLIYTSE